MVYNNNGLNSGNINSLTDSHPFMYLFCTHSRNSKKKIQFSYTHDEHVDIIALSLPPYVPNRFILHNTQPYKTSNNENNRTFSLIDQNRQPMSRHVSNEEKFSPFRNIKSHFSNTFIQPKLISLFVLILSGNVVIFPDK